MRLSNVTPALLAAFAFAACQCGPQRPPLTLTPDTVPSASVGALYEVEFGTSNGTAPIVFTLSAGDLPSGLLMTSDGKLSGRPLTAATSRFTIHAADASGATGDASYELIVSPTPITVSPAVLEPATRTVSYLAQLSAAGGNGGYAFQIVNGALPAGLSMSANGTISGSAIAAGTFDFVARATDVDSRSGESTVRLVVLDAVLTMTPAQLVNGTEGVDYAVTLVAAGGMEPYSFTIESGALPDGLTLDLAGAIHGRPTLAGTSSFTVRITDANALSAMAARTIAVASNALTISPQTLGPTEIGDTVNEVLTATGGTAPYSFSLESGALPPGLAMTSAGAISGIPIAIGTFRFNLRAEDATAVGLRSYSWVIAPAVVTVTPTTFGPASVGASYSVQLMAAGGRSPYLFTVTAGALPTGLTLSAMGLVSGTPTTAQTSTFTLNVVDTLGSGLTFTASIQVTTADGGM